MPVKPQGLRLCHDKQWSGSNPVAAAVGDCRLDSQSYRCFRELVVGCDQRGSYAAWSAPRRIFGQCYFFLRPISTIPFSNLTGSKRLRGIRYRRPGRRPFGRGLHSRLASSECGCQNYISKVKEKTQLLICSGNHDLDSKRSNWGESITMDLGRPKL